MKITMTPQPGQFCWLDLAARDAARARRFYEEAFGWTASDQSANGGHFTRLQRAGQDMGSLYQLAHGQVEGHVPSHWTPYIAVGDLQEALQGVERAGGRTLVPPVAIEGVTRIALIEDAVGALVGLWETGPGDN